MLKWADKRQRGFIGLLVFVAVIAVAASGCENLSLPETCEELAPRIIQLSEEREGPFTARILKFYDIEELEASGDYILKCWARAKTSRGGDSDVIFHMTEDEDGDRFIGMEPQ